MGSLREYENLCRNHTPEDFAKIMPGGFLVYNKEQGLLTAVDAKAGMTLARPLMNVAGGGPLSFGDMFEVFRIPGDLGRPASVGCGEDSDIIINDESISRTHASLLPTPDGLHVQDAGSTMGTQANGINLEGAQMVVVAPGKKVTLGNVELIYLSPERFHLFVRQMVP